MEQFTIAICTPLMIYRRESILQLYIICSKMQQKQQHPFNGPLSRSTRWAGTRKVNPIWIYWSKR